MQLVVFATETKGHKMDYKQAAEELWDLLDDIDTLCDQLKPENERGFKTFYSLALKICEKRHKIMQSDGYVLTLRE